MANTVPINCPNHFDDFKKCQKGEWFLNTNTFLYLISKINSNLTNKSNKIVILI